MLVKKYRGFEINLNTETGLFSCALTDDIRYNEYDFKKECKTLKGVIQLIDTFKKENESFDNFNIQIHPSHRSNKQVDYAVTGIRKDSKFIMSNNTNHNRKVSISEFSEHMYIVTDTDNKELYDELKKLDDNFEEAESKYKRNVKDIISKFKIVTLKDKKEELIGE